MNDSDQAGSDRIYICMDCDGDPRVRWNPPSAGFYVGCDCTSVPVVPQMGQFDAPDNWRVRRPICCRELDVTTFEFVYGGGVGHDYKCPDCGAVYRRDGRMVERPDAMLDESDDDQTVLPDGGTDRTECWNCGYNRLIFEACPECGELGGGSE